jgi:hypothetical protein
MTAHDPAALAAADHYAARARALADLPDDLPRPAPVWHIRAVALVERARRAELLDPEPHATHCACRTCDPLWSMTREGDTP